MKHRILRVAVIAGLQLTGGLVLAFVVNLVLAQLLAPAGVPAAWAVAARVASR